MKTTALVLCLALLAVLLPVGRARALGEGAPADAAPVLWRDRGDVAALDLFEGPAEAPSPDLARVTFLREEAGGHSLKFRVRDAAGRVWVAKLGREAQSETASVRLVWAAGYVTETSYLVPCARVEGAPPTSRRVERCEGEGFANVRFEARPAEWKRLRNWSWARNPFAGTRELRGLVVLQALLNNWDLKDANNRVVYVPGAPGRRGELRYIVSDLGTTFGRTGAHQERSRNEPAHYVGARLVRGVRRGRVLFNYEGPHAGLLAGITVADARWLGSLLARLSDEQLADAFRAANYPDETARALAAAARARINELVSL